MAKVAEKGYETTGHLVDTAWVADHLDDDSVRIVESNEDPLLYPSGHIPGAYEVDWTSDLNDPIVRDYLGKEGFEQLMSRIGATKDTKVVFYGDKNNWWACYAFWVFQLFGHTNCAVMDGGRIKWEKEDRAMTRDVPQAQNSNYTATVRDDKTQRALKNDVLEHLKTTGRLIDVRSPQEFTGERLHMEGYPNEGAVRGGHIPGANSVPWARAINAEDGTFLPADQLRAIYQEEVGLKKDDDVVTYCRIGNAVPTPGSSSAISLGSRPSATTTEAGQNGATASASPSNAPNHASPRKHSRDP